MGVIALSALLVAGTGFFLFAKALPNRAPGQKKLQADLTKLIAEVDGIDVELIPINVKELEALSTSQVESNAKSRSKISKGAFISIFEEVIFKYAYRSYASKKKDSVLVAKTLKRRYTFMTKGDHVRMIVDDQVLGDYDLQTNNLNGAKSKKKIASLEKYRPEQWMLKIKNRDVASMNALEVTDDKGLSKRVFEYVVDGISPEEKAVIVAITIYELVTLRH
ncbi:MAG: hypothetical protein Sapg2KO_20580 [Saprospiraceae bacterium]